MEVLHMTYSDAIRIRLQDLCDKRNITVNRLASLSGLTQRTVPLSPKKRPT